MNIKGNPELIERVLSNTQVPTFEVRKLEPGTYGLTESVNEQMHIYMVDLDRRYEDFADTVVHEFSHAYLQSMEEGIHARNSGLNEGITEFLSTQSIGKQTPSTYFPETDLARTLFELDKDALMDWYVGGSDEKFKERLVEALKTRHDPEEAVELADAVINMKKDRAEREAYHFAKKKKQLERYLDLSLNIIRQGKPWQIYLL